MASLSRAHKANHNLDWIECCSMRCGSHFVQLIQFVIITTTTIHETLHWWYTTFLLDLFQCKNVFIFYFKLSLDFMLHCVTFDSKEQKKNYFHLSIPLFFCLKVNACVKIWWSRCFLNNLNKNLPAKQYCWIAVLRIVVAAEVWCGGKYFVHLQTNL